MEANMATQIGYISSCIAGDHRYSSRLSVTVMGDEATVTLSENAPVGGMDGPGGTHPFEPRSTVTVPVKPAAIVKAIKQLIKQESPSVIGRYGKPTKRFVWVGVKERGLSVARCAEALAALVGEE